MFVECMTTPNQSNNLYNTTVKRCDVIITECILILIKTAGKNNGIWVSSMMGAAVSRLPAWAQLSVLCLDKAPAQHGHERGTANIYVDHVLTLPDISCT